MEMMFTVKALAAMCFYLAASVTGRTAERSAAPERLQTVKENNGRAVRTEAAEHPHWWEIENIDGRNDEHPSYMLPMILSDHPRQQS